jgi:polar amino acid transport system substrate-binding protein
VAAAAVVPTLIVGGIVSSGGSSGASTTIPNATAVPSLAAKLPAALRTAGTITVAADATYAPDEFVAADGQTVVGMDADLAKAIGQVLGLKVTLVNATFDTIIPALQSGKYTIGMSSFTDNKLREKVVNFVDYFSAGEGYYVKSGSSYKPNGLAALCGRSVAVESGTTEQSDAQSQNGKCKSANKKSVKVLTFADQNGANLAVSSGRANVGFVDSQVAEYIVAQSHGEFVSSGKAFATAPYGIAIPKGPGTTQAVQGAVQNLIKTGVYSKILKKWGIQAGAIKTATINGATS